MVDLLVEQYNRVFSDAEYQTNSAVSLLANSSAFIMEMVPNLNWAGFYLWQAQRSRLELGPFQGKLACAAIAPATGVCGTAYQTQAIQRLANVHEFNGHIACDQLTNSEMVIPLTHLDQKFGVLDLDSPLLNRFTTDDQRILTELAHEISQRLTLLDV